MARNIADLIDVARGNLPADIVIRSVRVFHLTDGSFETADIAIRDGVIAGVGQGYSGKTELDGSGLTAVPGFIDAHVHLESTTVLPQEFARQVLPCGVTTAICDPHELANVVGTEAFAYLYREAKKLPMDLQIHLSSCVPATHLETAGAEITSDDLAKWKRLHPEATLAEFMNVPGVLYKDPEVLRKLSLFDRIDGHCPLLSGKDLNAYISAGVSNCHESSSLEEAREKLRRGMQIIMREGSAATNFEELLPLLTVETSFCCSFCTDDRNPLDIHDGGHINQMVAKALEAGVPPLAAYRAASLSSARMAGLWDRGLIAPGQRADIVLLHDFEHCGISCVIAKGRIVDEKLLAELSVPREIPFRNTVKLRKVSAKDFPFVHEKNAPVIGLTGGLLLTDFLRMDTDNDELCRLAVLERHGKNGNIGLGWVHGLGLRTGAIASSVGHDSHNICVAGRSAEEMALAVNAIREMQGGFVVAQGEKVTGAVPLPVAGLMSDAPCETVLEQLRGLMKAVRATGCTLKSPLIQLAFLPLAVIPHLKLTDKGLVDVDRFELLSDSVSQAGCLCSREQEGE